jgi:MCM N-terminal domain
MSSQADQLEDQLESDRTRQFQEFLDDRVNPLKREKKSLQVQGTNSDAVKNMLDRKQKRLIVSLDDLRNHSRDLCNGYPFSLVHNVLKVTVS